MSDKEVLSTDSDAYVHVRLTGQPQQNGSLTVYLPDGTAIIVRVRDLVHLVARRSDPLSQACVLCGLDSGTGPRPQSNPTAQ